MSKYLFCFLLLLIIGKAQFTPDNSLRQKFLSVYMDSGTYPENGVSHKKSKNIHDFIIPLKTYIDEI
jgi:hypothetical protein